MKVGDDFIPARAVVPSAVYENKFHFDSSPGVASHNHAAKFVERRRSKLLFAATDPTHSVVNSGSGV